MKVKLAVLMVALSVSFLLEGCCSMVACPLYCNPDITVYVVFEEEPQDRGYYYSVYYEGETLMENVYTEESRIVISDPEPGYYRIIISKEGYKTETVIGEVIEKDCGITDCCCCEKTAFFETVILVPEE